MFLSLKLANFVRFYDFAAGNIILKGDILKNYIKQTRSHVPINDLQVCVSVTLCCLVHIACDEKNIILAINIWGNERFNKLQVIATICKSNYTQVHVVHYLLDF